MINLEQPVLDELGGVGQGYASGSVPASPGASPEQMAPASPATAQGLGTGFSKQSPQIPARDPRTALPSHSLTVPQGQTRSILSTSNPNNHRKSWSQRNGEVAAAAQFLDRRD